MDRHWRSKGKRFCYCFLQDVWSEKPSRIWRKARYYSANSLPYIRQKSFKTALVLFVILHRFFCSRILENSSAFPYSCSEQFSHLKNCVLNTNSHIIRELKQQRRLRLRKRHLKSEFAPLQTLSRSFHLVYFIKCWQMFLELNSKGLYQLNSKGLCFVFPSSTKREFRHFHVVVGQRRQRNVQKKRDARAKLLFC